MTAHRITPGLAGAPTEVDVVVIGLGITGAGVALDAVTRGLSVLAVDAHDLAFGTSRWSSKLVHGGLRYLASGQVGVAHESAVERGILMEVTAPHLTHAMPTLIPLSSSRLRAAGRRDPRRAARPATCSAAAPAPARTPCPGRASSRRPRRSRWRRRCARPGCAARCSAGTASSRTTPGWSPRWRAPRRRTAPTSAPAPGCSAATGTSVRAARRAHRRDARASPPARSSTPPASGPATWSTRSSCARAAAPTWCCASRVDARPPGRRLRAGAGRDQPVRAGAAPARRHGRTSASPTSPPTGRCPTCPQPTEPEIGFLLDVVSAAFEQPLHRSDVVGAYAGLRPLLDVPGGDGRDRRPLPQARRAGQPHRRGHDRGRQADDVPPDGRGRRRRGRRARRDRRRRRAGPATLPLLGAADRVDRWPGSSSRRGWSGGSAPTPSWSSRPRASVTGLTDDELLAPDRRRHPGHAGRAGLRGHPRGRRRRRRPARPAYPRRPGPRRPGPRRTRRRAGPGPGRRRPPHVTHVSNIQTGLGSDPGSARTRELHGRPPTDELPPRPRVGTHRQTGERQEHDPVTT